MSQTLDELLRAFGTAVDRGVDPSSLTDAIEALVGDDPEGSREAVCAFAGDEQTRLWAIGLLEDPRDFEAVTAGLADPKLRFTALEALDNQPDVARVDEAARRFLHDPDPRVRSKAAGMVAYRARPGCLAVLSPLADDPIPQVRMVLAWHLGQMRNGAAEPILRRLLVDPDERVRKFAARGLARLNGE